MIANEEKNEDLQGFLLSASVVHMTLPPV
jgi:hypothetical protein